MDAAHQPTVDIIIPTRNRGSLIEMTVSSIRASTGVALTLWVIDQSDDDRTEAAVVPHVVADPRVRYIRSATRGISAARNVGVALGQAPFVLFTDDDCWVEPGWAAALCAELAAVETKAVFGKVIPKTTGPAIDHPALAGVALAIKLSARRAVYQRNRFDLSFGHGANMGVRREVLEQLGGFDELLGVGAPLRSWEDRDLGFRILSAGGQIIYTPAAPIHHYQWRNWPGISRSYADYGIGAGAAAGKYLRYGDPGGVVLLAEWLFSQGLRQAISGAVKWRSPRKMLLGLLQLFYPWLGLWRSLGQPLSPRHRVYCSTEPPPTTHPTPDTNLG